MYYKCPHVICVCVMLYIIWAINEAFSYQRQCDFNHFTPLHNISRANRIRQCKTLFLITFACCQRKVITKNTRRTHPHSHTLLTLVHAQGKSRKTNKCVIEMINFWTDYVLLCNMGRTPVLTIAIFVRLSSEHSWILLHIRIIRMAVKNELFSLNCLEFNHWV